MRSLLLVSITLTYVLVTTHAVPTCPSVNGEIATLLPHESDCTKFYKCETGVAIVYNCPTTLYFNPVLKVCDYPEQAGCNGETGNGGNDGNGDGDDGGGDGIGGGDGGGGGVAPECPAEDGEFVTLIPHDDCTKFWKCDRGTAVEKDCPAGLQFNPVLLVCDYPEDAGCTPGQGGGTGGNGGGGGGGGDDGDNGTGGNDGGNGGGVAPECPAVDGEFVTLIPHDDCTKFWKCDRGTAVEKDCPAGLQFNPVLLVCDYPEDAGCTPGQGGGTGGNGGGGGGGEDDGDNGTGGNDGGNGGGVAPECPAVDGEFVTLIPHDDCTKFWKCDRGTAVEMKCPAGLNFNPVLLVCDYPEDAGCTPGNGGGTGGNGGGGGGGEDDGDNGTGGNDGGNGGGVAPECPAVDGEFVTLIPHDDCTKFWKCDRGTAVEMKCPAGLNFNPVLLVCDYPEDAGCTPGNGGGTGGNGGGGEGGEDDGDNGTGGNDGGNGGGVPPECPAVDGEFVTLIPHDDCTKFWKCDGGTAVEMKCPAGLNFNPVLLVCDYPEDAGCTPGQGGGTGGNGGGGEGGGDDGDNGTGGNDGGNGGGVAPECPAVDGEFVTLIPHDDCTKFWKCDRGTAVEMKCPAGLNFNPVLLVCDYPEDAGCTPGQGGGTGGNGGGGEGGGDDGDNGTGGNDGGNGGGEPPECPAVDGEFVTLIPHDDCTKFWKCDRGTAVEMKCPAGLNFNPVLLVCDYPEDAGCTPGQGGGTGGNGGGGEGGGDDGDNGTGGNDGGNGGGVAPECPAVDGEFVTLIPHDDCTKFWKCDRGTAVEMKCPAGLNFNPVLLVCDYPEDAGCTPGQGGGTGGNGGGGEGGGDDGDNGTGGNDGGNGGGEPPECPAVDGEFVTLIPHDDCTKFWKCDRGTAVEMKCPAGLNFNPVLLVCDYPEDAGCTPGQGGGTGGNGGGGEGGGDDGDNGTGGNDGGNGGGVAPECPAVDGEFVTLIPHDDCTKFWKCDRGTAVEMKCPAGLNFNPVLLVCDYPEDAGCTPGNGGGTGGNGGGEGGGEDDGDNGTGGNDGGNGGGVAPECPVVDGEFVTLIPHDDCTKFWKCDRGTAVEMKCPAGLNFNPVLLVCDYPEDAGCTPGNGGGTGGNDGGEGGGEDDGDNGTGGNDGGNGGGVAPECPAVDGEFVTLIPHDDCTKFWKCDGGTAVEMKCPAGLNFNPVLLVCDYPEDAGCTPGNGGGTGGSDGGGGGGGDDGDNGTGGNDGGNGGGVPPECPAVDEEFVTLIPHDDCTKFWKCDGGTAVEMKCPARLNFNPVLLVCDYPEDAGCTPGNGGGTGGSDGGGGGGGDDGDNGTGGNDGGNGGGVAPECPAVDGEFVTLIPHDDCTKFWKCDGGTAVEMTCPAGLNFNPVLLVCDYPEDAGCTPGNGGGTGGNGGGEGGGGDDGDNGTGGNDGGNGGGVPPECPAVDGEFVTLIPHDDCTKFWKCDRGTAVEKDCPAGLQFNPVLLVCDYPEDAGCTPGQGGGTGGNGGGGGGGGDDGDNGTGGNDGGNGGGVAPECPAVDGEFVTLIPHDDCTKFWKCDRGTAVEKDCPAGLQFNPVLLVCDYPEDAGCTPGQGGGTGGSGGGGGGGEDDGDNGTGGNDGGNGGGVAPECPAEDGEFVTLIPHDDCTKFWKCDRGTAVEIDCPAGLHFNPVLLICDYADHAGCVPGNGGGSGGTGGNGGDDGADGGGVGGGDDGEDDGDGGNGVGYCDTLGCPALNDEWVYFLPYPGDCTRFCKCNWGTPYEFVCPAGLHFNTERDVCDYKEYAKCST